MMSFPPLKIGFEVCPKSLQIENFDSALGWVVGFTSEDSLWALGFGKDPQAVERSLKIQVAQTKIFHREKGLSYLFQKVQRLFENPTKSFPEPLSLKLWGTPFQVKVWQTLTKIPVGSTLSYSSLAEQVGRPEAVRAVATAIGRNPISYFIPCHRVLRKGGDLGGYRWGLTVKQHLLNQEKAL